MEKEFKKLIEAHSKYEEAISLMESKILDKVQFENFSIFWQPSDGFVLEYETHNAPLKECLSIIRENGSLTLEEYMNLRI